MQVSPGASPARELEQQLQEVVTAQATELQAQRLEMTTLQSAAEWARLRFQCIQHTNVSMNLKLDASQKEIINLQLRLYKQKCNPGSLDLASEPINDRNATAIVRDVHVRAMRLQMHEMELQVGLLQSQLANKHV